MKASEIRNSTVQDLQQQLLDLYKEQSRVRMQGRTGQVSHYHHFGRIRKDIARIRTILQEKSMESAE